MKWDMGPVPSVGSGTNGDIRLKVKLRDKSSVRPCEKDLLIQRYIRDPHLLDGRALHSLVFQLDFGLI